MFRCSHLARHFLKAGASVDVSSSKYFVQSAGLLNAYAGVAQKMGNG